jgi:hypothetical protein
MLTDTLNPSANNCGPLKQGKVKFVFMFIKLKEPSRKNNSTPVFILKATYNKFTYLSELTT